MAEAGRQGIELFDLVPSRIIPILQRYCRDKMVTIEVDGKSMEPTIKQGAVIGVVPVGGDLIDGEMYLVKRPHFGVLVKRVYMGKDMLILKSDNPEHPPMELPYEGYELDTVILGRVIWIWQEV
jgi:phage repressor protein C with HTH and peptisase S24 domain